MILYTLRSLRRDPALVAGVLVTFALAIGANAAMFGLVSRLLLPAPPGVTDPTRVVRLTLDVRAPDGERFTKTTTSYPAFRSLQGARDAFSTVAAVGPKTAMIMGRAAEAVEVKTISATGDYFAVLGARPVLGRFFTAEEDQTPTGTPVVVLGHSFWKGRFAGERDVIGSSVVLDGRRFTVIGVAAQGFTGDGNKPVEVFVPLSTSMLNASTSWWTDPRLNLVTIVARLRANVPAGTASGAATIAARADVEGLTRISFESLVPSSMRQSPQARIAKWLLGVTLIVLLIAIANVGVLLLLRALHKRRDIAVRIALGASRRDLAAQLFTESMLLTIAGGTIGLVVSRWFGDIARVTLLPDLARSQSFVDRRVLVLTIVLVILAALLTGLAPLLLVAQRRITTELHEWSTFGSTSRSRLQRVLVGVQVALCMVLLVGAGLFVRSLQRVQGQDLGFSTANLLFVTLDFREELELRRRDDLHRDAVRRLTRVAGVSGATVVQATPFGAFHVPPISVPGLSEPPAAGGQLPMMYGATPEYLRLMGVRLVHGRLLTEQDRRGTQLVVLVNETMAREVWPGQSALGKCIRVGFDPAFEASPLAPSTLPCREVVGVVRDSRVRSLRRDGREASLMQYYVPFDQLPAGPFGEGPGVTAILVGVRSDAAQMMPLVQRTIQAAVDSPVYARVRNYQDLLDPQLRPWRLGATLFVAFGALAVGIAAVGLFGVVSYLVGQRTREIGLRLALGGTGSRVGRWVIAGALRMVILGCGLGLIGAAVAGPFARELLFETSPYDPGVLTAAVVILLAVTVVATLVPAFRAARVSPMAAMRVQ